MDTNAKAHELTMLYLSKKLESDITAETLITEYLDAYNKIRRLLKADIRANHKPISDKTARVLRSRI